MSKYLMAIQPQTQIDIELDDEGYLIVTEHEEDCNGGLKRIYIQPNNIKLFIDSLISITSKD